MSDPDLDAVARLAHLPPGDATTASEIARLVAYLARIQQIDAPEASPPHIGALRDDVVVKAPSEREGPTMFVTPTALPGDHR